MRYLHIRRVCRSRVQARFHSMVRPGIIVLPRTVPLRPLRARQAWLQSTGLFAVQPNWFWIGALGPEAALSGLDFRVVQWSGLAHHSGMRSANMGPSGYNVNDYATEFVTLFGTGTLIQCGALYCKGFTSLLCPK